MRTMTLAAFAAFALSVAGARAESNNLSAVETPAAPAAVQSSHVTFDTGSECSPVFSTATQETQGGPVAREGSAESTPVFALRPATVHRIRTATNS
ncbi:MAG: hypothetical protein JOZ42_02210 [Acetobacteraceae bacterium]|nr:hypothetical protein [Acetobacteraceae bacterium]